MQKGNLYYAARVRLKMYVRLLLYVVLPIRYSPAQLVTFVLKTTERSVYTDCSVNRNRCIVIALLTRYVVGKKQRAVVALKKYLCLIGSFQKANPILPDIR